MKEYVKPELEIISLVADEAITGELDIGGSVGVEEKEGW